MKRVQFYIGTDGVSKVAIEQAKLYLANAFKGYTWVQATGGWTSPDGALVVEHSAVVTVLTDTVDGRLDTAAHALRSVLDQTEVWFTVEPIELHIARKTAA